jgi:hypothetical protein
MNKSKSNQKSIVYSPAKKGEDGNIKKKEHAASASNGEKLLSHSTIMWEQSKREI